MSDDPNEDGFLTRIVAAVDRTSTVPVSAQLHGLLEFGITSGEFTPRERLPSVRKMASKLGLSPVTVSQVYARLAEVGLLEGRIGSGTFVRDLSAAGMTPGRPPVGTDFQERARHLAALGRAMGLSHAQILGTVAEALAPGGAGREVRVLVLGRFAEATASYAEDIRAICDGGVVVGASTLRDLSAHHSAPDIVAVPHNLRLEAELRFPGVPVLGFTMIPNEATRVSLARLAPGHRVVAVSYFPEFLSSLREGIRKYAPHICELIPRVLDDANLRARMRAADAVVFSTGAESVRDAIRPGQIAIEYRHSPDTASLEPALTQAVAQARLAVPTTGEKHEDHRQQLV